jgi:ATP-dependent Clp protease ATP-binding subunit ClpC
MPGDIRITDSGLWAMRQANQEIQRFNREYIGTEHILLGLVNQAKCVAAKVLMNLKVDFQQLRQEVGKVVPSGPDKVALGNPPLPRAKSVLEFALEEARILNHDYVGTGHLLLGLLREPDGVAGHILRGVGLDLEGVRQQVVKLLKGGEGAVD